MTPKQQLVAHLESMHGEYIHRGKHTHRGTHNQLVIRHSGLHKKHLTHTHTTSDLVTGSCQLPVRISLSPPKNAASNNAKDRNWVININQGHTGWRYEIPGTRSGDPDGAREAANKILGYEATWAICGWGFQVK